MPKKKKQIGNTSKWLSKCSDRYNEYVFCFGSSGRREDGADMVSVNLWWLGQIWFGWGEIRGEGGPVSPRMVIFLLTETSIIEFFSFLNQRNSFFKIYGIFFRKFFALQCTFKGKYNCYIFFRKWSNYFAQMYNRILNEKILICLITDASLSKVCTRMYYTIFFPTRKLLYQTYPHRCRKIVSTRPGKNRTSKKTASHGRIFIKHELLHM